MPNHISLPTFFLIITSLHSIPQKPDLDFDYNRHYDK